MSRIRFANQLRGVAALSVASSHWIGVFWVMPDIVSAVTATPPQSGDIPGIFWLVSHTWFNPGPFGVALFFLISGLVVPFSLDQHNRIGFLIARALRVFPTYAAAIAIETVAVMIAARHWDRPVPFTPMAVGSNFALLYDLIGQSSIDLVNWTLSVELKFYIVVAALASSIRAGRSSVLLLVGAVLALANYGWTIGMAGDAPVLPSTPAYTFSSHSVCVTYMLIGVLFNFHHRGKLSTVGLLVSSSMMTIAFLASWHWSVWSTQFPVVVVNYLYALFIFGVLYGFRQWIPDLIALDLMASISFPFYLVHSLIGYIVLKVLLISFGQSYYSALTITFIGVVGVSTALHFLVERPTQRLGRKLKLRQAEPLRAGTADEAHDFVIQASKSNLTYRP